MKYVVDNDMHIHSTLSSCSGDPGQTPQAILKYAEDSGIKTLCLTDHFWDNKVPGASEWYAPQDFEHICKSRPLPQSDKVRFLFGCEADMDKWLVLGAAKEHIDAFDFMVIATTHFHMQGFTVSDSDIRTPDMRAKTWIKRLDAVLDMDLPFHKIGFAHLACRLIAPTREELLDTLERIPESEMERVFAKVAKSGAGIELNSSDMSFADDEADIILRPFRVAKHCGCRFYLGSDAHHPNQLYDAIPRFERAVDFLGLEEADKFLI